ncbi:hypothetical protein FQZ97_683060 [compost metagenome]
MIMEACGQSTLGVFVHAKRANLKLDDLLIGSDDGGVKTLVAVWLWDSNIVFDT